MRGCSGQFIAIKCPGMGNVECWGRVGQRDTVGLRTCKCWRLSAKANAYRGSIEEPTDGSNGNVHWGTDGKQRRIQFAGGRGVQRACTMDGRSMTSRICGVLFGSEADTS